MPPPSDAVTLENFKRSATIHERVGGTDGEKSFELSFSSETPVRDFFGPPVVLLHEEGAADFSRLDSMLFNHNPDRIAGAIVSKTLDKKKRKGRAVVKFDADPDAQLLRAKVESGSLKGVSVSFSASESQRIGEDAKWKSPEGRSFKGPLVVATRWQAVELSLTPIGADPAAGVGRSQIEETPPMEMNAKLRANLVKRGLDKDATDEAAWEYLNTHPEFAAEQEAPPKPTVVAMSNPFERGGVMTSTSTNLVNAPANGGDTNTPDAVEAARVGERKRLGDIRRIADTVDANEETVTRWLASGDSAAKIREEAMDGWRAAHRPVGQTQSVDVGLDQLTKFKRYCQGGIYNRLKLKAEPHEKVPNDCPEWFSLQEMVREVCRMNGDTTSRHAPFNMVLQSRSFFHSISHFTELLENTANKLLRAGFEEAPTTYQLWTNRQDVPDFKTNSAVNWGHVQTFLETPELFPIAEQTIPDAKETFQLLTYATKFSISRQAFINDDLAGFAQLPRKIGQASARTANRLTYDHLSGSVTMTEDAIALFATTHTSGTNLSGSTAAPTVASITEGREGMRLQKGLTADSTGPALNLTPKFIIVPANYETETEQILNGLFVPTSATSAVTPTMRTLQIIVEPYLDSLDSTEWYMAVDPAQHDTIVVARLAGQQGPALERSTSGDVLGVAWTAFIDIAARAIDHRGLWQNT